MIKVTVNLKTIKLNKVTIVLNNIYKKKHTYKMLDTTLTTNKNFNNH